MRRRAGRLAAGLRAAGRLVVGLVVAGLVVVGLVGGARPAAALEIPELYDRLTGSCWSCSIFDRLVDFGLTLADQLFAALAGQVRTLLGLLLAAWLLILAARLFLPAGPAGARAWNQAARRLFGLAVVLALLQGSQGFWDYVFLPLLSSGAGLAGLLAGLGSGGACPGVAAGWGLAGAKAALKAVDCPLGLMQDIFSRGILTGVAMTLGAGWHSWIEFLKVWEWPLHFVQIVAGIVLALVYGFGFLVFPLLLVDVLMRAALVAALSPLALAAALFAPTVRVTRRALHNLAQAALTLAFAAVAAAIAQAVQTYAFDHLRTTAAMPTGAGDWRGLITALEAGWLPLSVIDESYWILLTTGVLALFLLRKSAAIAAEFTETDENAFDSLAPAAAAPARAPRAWAGKAARALFRPTDPPPLPRSPERRRSVPAGDGPHGPRGAGR